MASAAAWRVEKHHPRRVRTGPRTLIAGQRPQIPRLGLAPARIQNRRPGLVHEQMPGPLQVPGQPVHHRGQMKRRLAHPAGERGAVQFHAQAGVELRLAVERQMVRILGNEHLCQGSLGGQSALDQMRRCGCLDDALLAGPAGVLRAHRDDDAKLRRFDVQPLTAILADAHHLPASAGTRRAVRLDDPLDVLKVLRQLPDIASGAAPARGRARRRARLGGGLDLAHRPFQILERQLAVVDAQLLGFLVEDQPAQFVDQVFQATVGIGEQLDLRAKLFVVGLFAFQRRALLFEELPMGVWQRLQIDRLGVGLHREILSENQGFINENRPGNGPITGLVQPP